jgi:hypothetical protein
VRREFRRRRPLLADVTGPHEAADRDTGQLGPQDPDRQCPGLGPQDLGKDRFDVSTSQP